MAEISYRRHRFPPVFECQRLLGRRRRRRVINGPAIITA